MALVAGHHVPSCFLEKCVLYAVSLAEFLAVLGLRGHVSGFCIDTGTQTECVCRFPLGMKRASHQDSPPLSFPLSAWRPPSKASSTECTGAGHLTVPC